MNNTHYTRAELETIKALWAHASQAAILAALPGRTWAGIRKQAHYFKVRRLPNTDALDRHNKWTAEQLDLLQQYYPTRGALYVAELTGRSATAIGARAAALKLRRLDSTPAKHRPVGDKGLRPLVTSGAVGTGSIHTPRLNARKNERLRQEKSKPTPIADLVKALAPNSAGRRLYAETARQQGGVVAAQVLRDWLKQQAA